jgi:hypothetical protein
LKNLSSASAETKKFSQVLHDENDQPAKDAVWRFLFRDWMLDVEEGDKYGVDLVCSRDGEVVGYVEVERRHNDLNRFETIHVPFRKKKFFTLDHQTILFAVNRDFTEAFWVTGDIILQAPVEDKVNKYLKSERFFVVPKAHWKRVKL